MNDPGLVNAIRFYLRRDQRLKRAGLNPLAQQPDWAEVLAWDYARRAADRLERLRGQAGRMLEPVPVKRRRDDRRTSA